jgi:predicted nuclease of predicted toxin-antitoxin system
LTRPYLKQKLKLYFDENFPREIIESLKQVKAWKRKCKIHSVYDFGNQNKDDRFQYAFCKSKGYVLVTLDEDFWNDTLYPLDATPGLIQVIAGRNDPIKIQICLEMLLTFLSMFPFPKSFVGNSKFRVSAERCVIKGRDAKTGEIKIHIIVPGDTLNEVAKFFGYF